MNAVVPFNKKRSWDERVALLGCEKAIARNILYVTDAEELQEILAFESAIEAKRQAPW